MENSIYAHFGGTQTDKGNPRTAESGFPASTVVAQATQCRRTEPILMKQWRYLWSREPVQLRAADRGYWDRVGRRVNRRWHDRMDPLEQRAWPCAHSRQRWHPYLAAQPQPEPGTLSRRTRADGHEEKSMAANNRVQMTDPDDGEAAAEPSSPPDPSLDACDLVAFPWMGLQHRSGP